MEAVSKIVFFYCGTYSLRPHFASKCCRNRHGRLFPFHPCRFSHVVSRKNTTSTCHCNHFVHCAALERMLRYVAEAKCSASTKKLRTQPNTPDVLLHLRLVACNAGGV